LKIEFWGKRNPISKFLGLKSNEPKSDVAIMLKEAGTQSDCTITQDARQCSIHCFDTDYLNSKHRSPEFHTTYIENGKSIANGRTFDMRETMEAIKNWLQNRTIEELYARFSFIDKEKRELENLRAEINAANAQLRAISRNEVAIEGVASYHLWFKNDSRSCRIYYYGYESRPRYIFYWDDCMIFETSSSDTGRLGLLIRKWVFDKEMPSVLKVPFPEIEFGRIAEFYENGNGIEGEFILSWDTIETFYREGDLDTKAEVLRLIALMRAKGFDRTLRAGQSLYTLVVSRSRRHGLRQNQSSVSFSFNFIKCAMEVRASKGEKIEFDKIEYNDIIENLLMTIQQENVD